MSSLLLAHAATTSLSQPISTKEIAAVAAFLAVVGAGVFLLIRGRRHDGAPRMSLDE